MASYQSVFRGGLFAGTGGIVTGAGSGIGRCTAHELAALGARVALIGRKPEKLEAVAREISEAGGTSRCCTADIREEARVQEVVRGVLADFGLKLPDDTDIRVWDSTAETRFIVVPMRPAGTDGWSEDRLARLVTRNSMIGTGQPLSPKDIAR